MNNYQGVQTDETFQITEYTTDNGILTKEIGMDSEGKIRKYPDPITMKSGTARKLPMTLPGFPEYLMGLGINRAIGHGICEFEKTKITILKNFKNKSEAIPRSKDYFHYSDGATLAMIDHDPEDGQPVRDYQEVIKIIDSVCPGFAAIPKVLTYSTSSCIYHGNTELRGKGAGFHLYFLVKNGTDLPRFAEALFHRLWLAGHGYIKISRSG